MALQSSGAISLLDIQNEFGGSNPIGINEYYRGGAYVPSSQTSIPTSGTIDFADFYGTSSGGWPCLDLFSSFSESQTGQPNFTLDIYGEYFTPTAGSFTFYFDLTTDTNVSSLTAYLYRGTTLLTSRTGDGTYTTTLQATQHRFRLRSVFSGVPVGNQRNTGVIVRQSNSSGCIIQQMGHSYENIV